MPTLHATARRILPHRVRALVPRRLRRFLRRWVGSRRAGRRAARLSDLTARAEAAAADKRWSDEAQLWESIIGDSGQAPPRAFVRLAKAQRRSGDPDRAVDALQRGLGKYPADLLIATEHAQHAVAQEDWAAAALRWQAVIDLAEDPPRTPYLTRLEAAERENSDRNGSSSLVVPAVMGDAVHADAAAHQVEVDSRRQSGDPATGPRPRARSRDYLGLALAHQRQGDHRSAGAVLARGVDRHPNDSRLAKAYAENATHMRDWPAAVERWEALLHLEESDPRIRAFVEIARAQQMLGDLFAARSVLDRGVEQVGEHRSLFAAMARLAMAERKWDQAVTLWQEVLLRDESPKAYRGLVRAYSGQNDFGAASHALDRAREQYPRDAIVSVEAIFLLIAQERWDDARAEWESQISDGIDISAKQHATLARRCSVNFHPDLADAFIEHALEVYPDDIDVKRQAVRNAVFRERRQRPPHEWNWESAVRRAADLAGSASRSDAAAVYLAVAHELTEAGALGEARDVLHSYIDREGVAGEVWGELFTLAMAQGEWKEAARYVRAKREVVGTLGVYDLIGLARAHVAAGQYDDAREALGEPSVSDRHHVGLRFESALVEASAGHADLAVSMLERLSQAGAGSVVEAVHRQLAIGYRMMGDERASRRVVKKARERFGPSAIESNPGVVAIIGGGPSLRGVDLEVLRGTAHCVAVNATAMALPWCDVAVTHDVNHLVERFHGFGGPVVTGASPEFIVDRGRVRGFQFRRRIITDRLSELDDVLHSGGHTSAHTALGYAYRLRPRRIVIFGVDLKDFWGPDEYWHDKADQFNRKSFEDRRQRVGFATWEEYRRRKLADAPNVFASTLPQLRDHGVEVVNASLESTVDCFPRVSPQDGIDLCQYEGPVLDR